MMIKTAGGPGLVSPIDFHERRTPRFTRTTWIATGIVVAAHIGVGAVMYYQRFEMPPIVEQKPGPIFDVITYRPKPPVSPKVSEAPPAPNPPLHDTPRPTTPTETFAAIPTDAAATSSTTLTFTEVVIAPVDNTPVVPPTPTPTPPSVIRNPSWARQPSADQMMRAYPGRAITAGISGSASLNCLVLPSGGVTDCNVTQETPGGYGFGRAAQGLSRHFRVNPRTVDGAAVGSRVAINLRFNVPED